MKKFKVPSKFLNTYFAAVSDSHKKFMQVKLSKYGASCTNGDSIAYIARIDFGAIMTLNT